MSADRIDVLAVMDAAVAILVEDGAHYHIPESENDELRNLREARAAVAELIERERAERQALLAFVNLATQRKESLGELSEEMEKCLQDGRAALARVGGAACRAAVAELIAAAEAATSTRNIDMATVRGRNEMSRRLDTLRAAIARVGGAP